MKRRAFLLSPLVFAPIGSVRAQASGAPLRIIVAAPAGGAADRIARLLADKLKGIYAPVVNVDNVAGAGGRRGVEAAKAEIADGGAVLFTPDYPMTVYPNAAPRPGYDPLRDFIPISLVVRSPVVLAATPGGPADAKSLKDVAAWVKANPQRATYAARGMGQLAAPLIEREAGIRLKRQKGADAPIVLATLGDLLPDLREGRARVLAVAGSRRAALLPDVPTMAESGYASLVMASWLGFFAPAGTPADSVKRLANAVADASGYGAVQQELFKLGYDPVAMTPVGFANLLRADLERWAPLVRSAGFTDDA